MTNKIVASLAAIPFALAGVFAGTGAANADPLVGEFQLNPALNAPLFENSSVFLTKDALYFKPEPTGVIIDSSSPNAGSFTAFNLAVVSEILSFGPPTDAVNPFLDFGFATPPILSDDPTEQPSVFDGLNVFNLDEASYELMQNGANVSIQVELWGDFVSETGEVTKGAGNLTFQYNNSTVAELQAKLDSDGEIDDMTFSGGLFATASTPEPTTLFGLGVVAAGLTVSRRKK